MESIEGFVIEQLASWEVPGCAVAAVQDGQTVLTAGWGQRDLDAGSPVTSDTLFAIGSVTKAFTAATVGALVDEGLLEWERPLRDYLPELRLYDPVVTDRLTVVDLLSHRSGLPRHDLVWLGYPDRSRAEVVRRLRFLPLSKDLRQAFQYCNLGYLVAGYGVEVLSGRPWEDFLSTRLLTPLGMGRSNLSVDDMTADPDHATAYERRQGVVGPVPLRPVTVCPVRLTSIRVSLPSSPTPKLDTELSPPLVVNRKRRSGLRMTLRAPSKAFGALSCPLIGL